MKVWCAPSDGLDEFAAGKSFRRFGIPLGDDFSQGDSANTQEQSYRGQGLRIAYAKGAQNGVWYAQAFNMWIWMLQMVEDGNMWSPVLALDADNRPHIAYYVANDGALAYATKSDETWDIQIVEDDASPSIRIGREPSIALGVCDLPRIAYYYHDSSAPCQLKYARARRPADFDGDGDVDTADLLYLLGCWGQLCGDVDSDGTTNTQDLLALLAAWGECP